MKKIFTVMGAVALSGASMYGGYMIGANKRKIMKKLPSSLGVKSSTNQLTK